MAADPDTLLTELETQTSSPAAPKRNGIAKLRYTHEALVDLIVQNPGISQNSLAAAFGFTPSWVCTIIASDAFQERLAKRREEVVDPFIKATMEERFRALAIQSLEVLRAKLAAPQVSDNVALRAAELGAKALGIGGNAAPVQVVTNLDSLAERLIQLRRAVYNNPEKVINGQAETVPDASAS